MIDGVGTGDSVKTGGATGSDEIETRGVGVRDRRRRDGDGVGVRVLVRLGVGEAVAVAVTVGATVGQSVSTQPDGLEVGEDVGVWARAGPPTGRRSSAMIATAARRTLEC